MPPTVKPKHQCVFCGEVLLDSAVDPCPACFISKAVRDEYTPIDPDLRIPFRRLASAEWREISASLHLKPTANKVEVQAALLESLSVRKPFARRSYHENLKVAASLLGVKEVSTSCPQLEKAFQEALLDCTDKQLRRLRLQPLKQIVAGPIPLAARFAPVVAVSAAAVPIAAASTLFLGARAFIQSGIDWQKVSTWLPIIHEARIRG